MKKYINYLILSVVAIVSSTACTEYLDIPVEASKTEADIFSDYYNFQGFVDQMYNYVSDPVRVSICADACYAGETYGITSWSTGYNAVRGTYKNYLTRGYFSIDGGYGGSETDYGPGCWDGWLVIRMANIGLNNLDLLSATDEEKAYIEGQLLFFRGFSHQEILAGWGPIPFVDEVLADDFALPRFHSCEREDGTTVTGYQATVEYILDDLNRAAELLPAVWASGTTNLGRATSLAAKSYEARAALFAGSPLMVQWSGTSTTDLKTPQVDTYYMERAATAAAEAIAIAEANSADYALVSWSEENTTEASPNPYTSLFYTVDGISVPWTTETIWGNYQNITSKGSGNITNGVGRIQLPDQSIFGGNAVNCTVTQNYVDIFEMADGTLYKKEYDGKPVDSGDYDADGTMLTHRMWDDRDPRFRRAVFVDRDEAGNGTNPASTVLTLYTDDNSGSNTQGVTRSRDNCATPYFIHKWWPNGANKTDAGTSYTNMRMLCPLMRLSELYLIYAEAVYQSTGSATNKVDGCSMTALEAVNAIRTRCGHVPTDANGGGHATGTSLTLGESASYNALDGFMKQIIYERAVEHCFEGQFWFDIRRYRIGTELGGETLYTLDFDKKWSTFTRTAMFTRTFDETHYWLPLPSAMCKIYAEFPQNPGWE